MLADSSRHIFDTVLVILSGDSLIQRVHLPELIIGQRNAFLFLAVQFRVALDHFLIIADFLVKRTDLRG